MEPDVGYDWQAPTIQHLADGTVDFRVRSNRNPDWWLVEGDLDAGCACGFPGVVCAAERHRWYLVNRTTNRSLVIRAGNLYTALDVAGGYLAGSPDLVDTPWYR